MRTWGSTKRGNKKLVLMKCGNIKCSNEHDGSFGSGKFCSRACANSRNHSSITKLKISEGVKNSPAFKESLTLPNYINRKRPTGKRNRNNNIRILNTSYSLVKSGSIRKRIILEQENKCFNCGIDKWLDQPICLELDHINGNNKDNSRENLRALCPNCHSLTPTWRGRNRKDKINNKKIELSEYVSAYNKYDGNISQALISLGLVGKGGNYRIMYKALNEYGIKYVKQSKR